MHESYLLYVFLKGQVSEKKNSLAEKVPLSAHSNETMIFFISRKLIDFWTKMQVGEAGFYSEWPDLLYLT